MKTVATKFILACFLLGLAGCPQSAKDPSSAAGDNPATAPWVELKTRNSRYRIRIDDSYEQVPAGQMHYWDIHVMSIDEQPLTPQRLKVSGTMPGHGHGMATFPKATALQEIGLMRVKGMKFHMGGVWRLRIDINDTAGPDYAYFNIDVQPAPVTAKTVTFTQQEIAQLKALRLKALPPHEKDPVQSAKPQQGRGGAW